MTESINPNIRRKRKSTRSVEELLTGLKAQDRYALSEALTLIEREDTESHERAQELLSHCTSVDSASIRIGVTGSPGAGKSTFIEQLGLHLLEKGHRVAVLAVDPSSTRSQGSILGDKTRMADLSNHPDAYIRPTASASHLGGVSRSTKESIAVCELAGYDIIIVESVGVGQSEVELASHVDVYTLLLLPGGGDDVQGIKRGVVELADVILVNKCDGEREDLAKQSKKDYQGSVRLFSHDMSQWKVPVVLMSALQKEGISDAWDKMTSFVKQGRTSGYFTSRRKSQDETYIKTQSFRYVERWIEREFFNETDTHDKDDQQSLFQRTQNTLNRIKDKLK